MMRPATRKGSCPVEEVIVPEVASNSRLPRGWCYPALERLNVDCTGLRTIVFHVSVDRSDKVEESLGSAAEESGICFSQVGVSIVVRIRNGGITLVDILLHEHQAVHHCRDL